MIDSEQSMDAAARLAVWAGINGPAQAKLGRGTLESND